jgi:hypothetical protein
MAFRRGPDVKPFAGTSQEPLRLLQSVTPVELASAVPFIKITKVDFRTGRVATDVPPLMYDLVRTPVFTDFGSDSDSFIERSNVSLLSMNVKSQMPNGDIMYREVTLNFMVHRPAVMFDRDSKVPWREILEEGNSFILEYGWKADPTICRNPLFNGLGHVDRAGTAVLSTRTTLMYVYRWLVNLMPDGQVSVTVNAIENGDLALRDARFSDAFESAFGGVPTLFGVIQRSGTDAENAQRVRALLDGLPRIQSRGRTELVSMGDILDRIVAPVVEKVMRKHAGYDPNSPVEFLLADFNARVGKQSDGYGSRMPRSIGDFLVPLPKLREELSRDFASGRSMTLQNFIRIIIGFINSDEGWSRDVGPTRPIVALKLSTVTTAEGVKLVFALFDRRSAADTMAGLQRIPVQQQTKERIRSALVEADVPTIEFGRADSVILDASFEMQPNPLLQSIQVEEANFTRKDRVQATQMPDVESRRGQSVPREIVPVSILEGDITFQGNFIFDPPSVVWVDFFGSRAISGIFNILEQTDSFEPGKFTTTLHLISEGRDPLNTRGRLTDQELESIRTPPARGIQRKKKR